MSNALPVLHLPLASIRVGQPRTFTFPETEHTPARPWSSAIQKAAINKPVWLSELNLAGDLQADQQNHGGPDQALCVYPGAHYAGWSARLGQELTSGSFGENLTLAGSASEADVCLGDVFALGGAVVQISQPRSPCYKLGRRWQTPLLPRWLQDSGFTGWYMRVLEPGLVAPGDQLLLLRRPCPEWPLPRVNSAKYAQRHDRKLVEALAACPVLGRQWQRKLQGRLSGTMPLDDDANRLLGPATG
ncbi:MOSC domain-containing protein [Hymenobacter sp. BT175]|uniref:MOSC domain-containing protein n=1 Tax=Hymenobacter translucens TaxID=2886507 RepID=UPI001D0E68C2|nr:MOSC domain-containing protein [Hymenobacter translucens]MCC2547634.1 MOSC domain-containing protein [Hymenobacter translucens]